MYTVFCRTFDRLGMHTSWVNSDSEGMVCSRNGLPISYRCDKCYSDILGQFAYKLYTAGNCIPIVFLYILYIFHKCILASNNFDIVCNRKFLLHE